MTKKLSALSSATLPLTGSETMPMMQDGEYVQVGVGFTQMPTAYGDLPTVGTPGQVAYVPDAAGGPKMAFWDGTDWRQFGGTRSPVKPMGEGIFIACVGPSQGPAAGVGWDMGAYFFSLDGYKWDVWDVPQLKGGITHTAYANGVFLFTGYAVKNSATQRSSVSIITTQDPRVTRVGGVAMVLPTWTSDPPEGYNEANSGQPDDASDYDEPNGVFTVPIIGVGDKQILNPLPRAITPDPSWPTLGDDTGATVVGMGTRGLVEVRIDTKILTVLPSVVIIEDEFAEFVGGQTKYVIPSGQEGSYPTDFLLVRPVSSMDWQPVGGLVKSTITPLNGNEKSAAGISLRGLIWGPIKTTAVQFQP